MSETLTGQCFCGAVRYRLAVAAHVRPLLPLPDCQRQAGSAFAINALIERDRIALDVRRTRRPRDEDR